MSRPYAPHRAEIEAAHKAILATGRPIILSLSPGETPVEEGPHVSAHAQMWRISDDFWDEWRMLRAQFDRLERWTPYRKPGAWPDADMLPLGRLALGKRDSRFTPDEQQTLMTLWAIARSPLIMGGDLRHLDAPTLRLLTNRDVIAVNQASTGNRPLAMPEGSRAWVARAGKGGASYLALFNLKDAPADIAVSAANAGLNPRRTMRDLWSGETFGPVAATVSRKLPAHGSCLLRIS